MEDIRQILGEQFTALRAQIAASVVGQQTDHDALIRLQVTVESVVSELRHMRTGVDEKHHQNQAAYAVLEQRIQLNSDTRYKELCERLDKHEARTGELERAKASLYAGVAIVTFAISSLITFGSKLWK